MSKRLSGSAEPPSYRLRVFSLEFAPGAERSYIWIGQARRQRDAYDSSELGGEDITFGESYSQQRRSKSKETFASSERAPTQWTFRSYLFDEKWEPNTLPSEAITHRKLRRIQRRRRLRAQSRQRLMAVSVVVNELSLRARAWLASIQLAGATKALVV